MNIGLAQNTYSGITNGSGALQKARQNADSQGFAALVEKIKAQGAESSVLVAENAGAGKTAPANGEAILQGAAVAPRGRLNGDWTSGFAGTFASEKDKNARPTGAAANQANVHAKQKTIDKTSELYEKSLELENYFVKQMLSEMRKTVHKAYEGDFAQNMYEDMLYDEYSTALTKNAGFGLADQIYLSLV